MYADVFVYPGPTIGTPCDTVVATRAITDQIAGFRDGFPTMIERHYVDSIAVVDDRRLAPNPDVPWCVAEHLTLAVVREGTRQRSDYFLYVLSGYFVKIRITYSFTPNRLTLQEAFTNAVFSRLSPK
jgi:hypothetical protein